MFGLDPKPPEVRPRFRAYADNLRRAGVAAMAGPRNVEGEGHGFDCYHSTPGEGALSDAWHDRCQADVIAAASAPEIVALVQALAPIWHEDTTFRGRSGPCGDWETITCPTRVLRDSALYWLRDRAQRLPFAELVQLRDLLDAAALPVDDFASLGLIPTERTPPVAPAASPPPADRDAACLRHLWSLCEAHPGAMIEAGLRYQRLYDRDLVLTHGIALGGVLYEADHISALRAALRDEEQATRPPRDTAPGDDVVAALLRELDG